jgi:hypothetical protein
MIKESARLGKCVKTLTESLCIKKIIVMNRRNQKSKTLVHPAAMRLLVDATWDFAKSILWKGTTFSKAEEAVSKVFIRMFYESIPPERFAETSHHLFSVYCQRIILAKNYVERFPHRFIPHPCMWLNPDNAKGFAGTKQWYLNNLKRCLCCTCPNHSQESA